MAAESKVLPLPWERLLWSHSPLLRPRVWYALTDFRLVRVGGGRFDEIVLQDIREVSCTRSRLDRVLGAATLAVHAREARRAPIVVAHIRRGPQLAALIELLAGDPRASLDADGVRAALEWDPQAGRRGYRGALAGAAIVLATIIALATGLPGNAETVSHSPEDPIYPSGRKESRENIVRFMETAVMPWARSALAPIKGGADRVTCATCHGADAEARDWQMPSVAALPEPHVRLLGWEMNRDRMNAQMRNAIYGYLAESDNQARAAYMRDVVMPGMAHLLHRPAYDFTRSYEYNRSRLAFGCYHCHRVN